MANHFFLFFLSAFLIGQIFGQYQYKTTVQATPSIVPVRADESYTPHTDRAERLMTDAEKQEEESDDDDEEDESRHHHPHHDEHHHPHHDEHHHRHHDEHHHRHHDEDHDHNKMSTIKLALIAVVLVFVFVSLILMAVVLYTRCSRKRRFLRNMEKDIVKDPEAGDAPSDKKAGSTVPYEPMESPPPSYKSKDSPAVARQFNNGFYFETEQPDVTIDKNEKIADAPKA